MRKLKITKICCNVCNCIVELRMSGNKNNLDFDRAIATTDSEVLCKDCASVVHNEESFVIKEFIGGRNSPNISGDSENLENVTLTNYLIIPNDKGDIKDTIKKLAKDLFNVEIELPFNIVYVETLSFHKLAYHLINQTKEDETETTFITH